MLSTVIRSETAIKVSIQIMETFVRIRKQIHTNDELIHRLIFLEKKQNITDEKVDLILKSLESDTQQNSKGIFFEGQLFDAYVFANDLIKSGKHSIILHPSTVIQIEGGQTYWLQTTNVCDYLRKNKNALRELETNKFKGLKTKSYIVNIEDLVNYNLQMNYQEAA